MRPIMVEWTLLILLVVVCFGGVVLSAIQLPGNWVLLAAAVGYDAYYHWERLGWKWLVVIGGLAVAGEAAELLASAVAASKAGASRRAGIGALVGGFAGMILFSIPVPILGTIAGGMAGCFLGALVAELTLHDDVVKGAKIGLFATIGRLFGLVAKLAATMAMAGAAVSVAVVEVLKTR